MKFGTRVIGPDQPPFLIAEVGANHNGNIDLARALIDSAAQAGADCVKFQSWSKDSIFAREVYDNDQFLSDGRDDGRTDTLEAAVERYSLSPADHQTLAKHCAERGILFASSAFSPAEADFLAEDIKAPFIKIASMDVNNLPFLEYVAGKGRPLILSTGLASLSEIATAVDTIRNAGCADLALLHCIAQYPPADAALNLRNIEMLRSLFSDCPIGYSDHSIGTSIPLAAIALGACIIEKHFTLDQNAEGWDHAVSATPEELAVIAQEGRRIATATGSYERQVTEADLNMRPVLRRSIVAARDIPKGKFVEREDLDFKRPGRGIPPTETQMVVGRMARRDIAADELIELDAL